MAGVGSIDLSLIVGLGLSITLTTQSDASIVIDSFSVMRLLVGDFDNNGVVDATDIDLLCDELGGTNADFDLNNDGMVNLEDARELVENILETEFGDANLTDGTTLADLGILATNFNKTGEDLGWSDADFTWDGNVTLADLGILAENFGANGPISQAEFEEAVEELFGVAYSELVPEPTTVILLSLFGVMVLRRDARK